MKDEAGRNKEGSEVVKMKVKIKVILTVILIGVVAVGTSYIRAQGTASISGKVLQNDGVTPVEGMAVFSHDENNQKSLGSVYTDLGGGYRFQDIPAGIYKIMIFISENQIPLIKTATIQDGQDLTNFDFVLPSYATLTGSVFNRNLQSPLSNVQVFAAKVETGETALQTTDSDGRFIFKELPEGKYHLIFKATNHNDVNIDSIDIISNEPPVNLNVIMGNGNVTGKVSNEAGMAIADASILFKALKPFSDFEMINSDANGIYTVTNLTPAEYEVTAVKPGYKSSVKSKILVQGDSPVEGVDFVLQSEE